MRNLLTWLSPLLIVAVLPFVATAPSADEMADFVLPIEVMHYDVFGEQEGNSELPMYGSDSPRYVKSVTFDVSGDPGELWLWGHQIGFQYFWDHFEWQQGAGDLVNNKYTINSPYDAPYDGRAKASVRINGGSWVDITNDNVTCAEQEEAQKCIGGFAGATRFKVNGSQLQEGSNTVEFAFLGHDMLSSGYRILDIVALPAGYSGSLSHRDVRPVDLITNNKVMDYLDTEAPEGSDAQAGETLWHADNSLLDFPGGPEIVASCNDCHAQDGRDLEFFGYSNESITVRSMHHGLTEQEGENIAAYIRSQDLTYEDGTSYTWRSRPWHPPYQPGPAGFGPNNEGPDQADPQFWSAGAGLEWVADLDNEALPYVFSDGTGDPQAGPFVDPPNLAIQSSIFRIGEDQLNLREIPIDVQFPDWNRWLPIIHPRDYNGDEWFFNSANGGNTGWSHYQAARASQGNAGDIYRTARRSRESYRDNGPLIDNETAWNRVRSRTNRAAQQWIAVKLWELHHEFNVEGPKSDHEARSWVRSERAVFDIASHITGNGTTDTLDGPPFGAGTAFSHLWYHMQMILNANIPSTTGQSPVDWNYQEMYMRGFGDQTGLPAATRTITTISKKDQVLGERFGVDEGQGFNNHRHGLREIYRAANGGAFSGLDSGLRNDVVSSYLSAWAWYVHQWEIEDFPRGDDDRNKWGLPTDNPTAGTPTPHGQNNAANNHYRSLIWFDNNLSIELTTLDSLARWGNEMWSEASSGPGWESWFIENLPPFALTMAGGGQQVAPGVVTLTASPDGSPDEVRFYQDDVLIGTVTSAPWEIQVGALEAGNYTFNAESQEGEVILTSGNRFLEVLPEWVTSRLEQRARGPVTGSLSIIDDERLALSGTGVNTGLRRKFSLDHVEAHEECIDDSEIEFTIDDATAPAGRAWTRAGFKLEGGSAEEVYIFEYLPLQRRLRILVADHDRSWFTQERSITNVDLPIKVRVHSRIVSDIFEVTTDYDTTGDGVFDRSHFYIFGDQSEGSTFITSFVNSCNWSLFTTSRAEGEEAEAAFRDIDVIRPIQ